MRLFTAMCVLLLLLLTMPLPAQIILQEDFEGAAIDARISFSQVGAFSVAPAIRNTTVFGSTKAYGFGRSVCGANCFFDYTSTMTITFSSPVNIARLEFREIELYGNWGGQGEIRLDGVRMGIPTDIQFGRLPQNDHIADVTYRSVVLPINQTVTVIQFRSYDITNESENLIDDLFVIGANSDPVAHAGSDITGYCPAPVILDGSLSSDPDQDQLTYAWMQGATILAGPTSNASSSVVLPLGIHPITLLVDDGHGGTDMDEVTITIVDQTAPTFVQAGTSRTLWPPNHLYETVMLTDIITGFEDECDPDPSARILSVLSDEEDDAIGDGDGSTIGDITLAADCQSVQLRRERAGGGNGRVYTIIAAVLDASGNAAYAQYQVSIPHSANSVAVLDNAMETRHCGDLPRRSMTITAHFSLDNYPNPFNPITTIAFEIPENGHVLLTLHDLLGRHLTTLLDSEHTSGSHSLHFDASHLPSGLYIYRLAYNGHILTRTMSLLK